MKYHWTPLLLAFAAGALTGCSAQALKRSAFETVQSAARQQCARTPGAHCDKRTRFEDYQVRRTAVIGAAH